MPQHKPTIFFSYSHLDRACLDELLKVVKPTLEHSFDIEAWSDREIESGGQWRSEIAAALDAARVAVLLISNGFLGSNFIRSEELPMLLPRERAGGLRLFTLYVTAVPKPALRIPLPDAEDYDLLGVQAENVPDSPLQGMDETARTALFVNLAEKLHAHLAGQEASRPNRSPATRVSPRQAAHGPRPECLIRLHREGAEIARDFLFQGSERWVSPEIQAPDACNALELWQPGSDLDGDLLFELLFGNESSLIQEFLGDPFGEGGAGSAAPSRYPWRIRLLIDDQDADLQCLPWTRISHQGLPLAESGWTLELSPPAAPGTRPELPSHSFIMPGRIVLVFPDDAADPSAAHRRDLLGLLQGLWQKAIPPFVATDAQTLATYLDQYAPRLVYFYGRVRCTDGHWRLCIPGSNGQDGLGFDALGQMLSSVPPSAIFLNLLGEDAMEAFPETAALTDSAGCKLLALQATAKGEAAAAQRSALAWLEAVLRDDQRRDPVQALHDNGHAFAACRAAYGQWAPQLGDSTGADDMVDLLLDRTKQRARLLQARDDFFDLSAKLRVQCFLAVGTSGNRVLDFPHQASMHLRLHPKTGVQAALHAIEVQPTDTDLDRLETRYRASLGLKPSQGLAEGLRPAQTRYSNEHLLPVLGWTLTESGGEAQRQAVAKTILRWSRERLAPACPDDMRIISLMAVEAPEAGETEALADALDDYDEDLTDGQEYRRTTAFRYEALEILSGVRKRDMRHYFDSELCSCPDGLRRIFPGLLLAGSSEMVFEEAVDLIHAARQRGWHAMKTELEQRNNHRGQ